MDGWMAVVGTSGRFGTRLSKSLTRGHELNHYRSGTSDSAGSSSKSPALQKLHTTYVKDSFDLLQQRICQFELLDSKFRDDKAEELTHLVEAQHAGITYVIGHLRIKAKSSLSSVKKFLINGVLAFLRRNIMSPLVALNIPQVCLIEVGMNYHV